MVEVARSTGGTVVEAASLEELADELGELGVPRDALFRTLEEYNAAVASGTEMSPPRTGPARPLREPPFVAVKVAPYITHTVGGLVVDAGCRVLREVDAGPIPGLYAAGVEVGGVSSAGTRAASPRPSSSAESPRSRRSRTVSNSQHDRRWARVAACDASSRPGSSKDRSRMAPI